MAIKWYATGGKRYFVIGVSGYLIDPGTDSSMTSSKPPTTAYSVLDRDEMHREIQTFIPRGGRSQTHCWFLADELARELNRQEAEVAA